MSNRPRSVTVISWIFIVFGSIALLGSLAPKSPEVQRQIADYDSQHPVLTVLLYINVVLAVICGVGMLRGYNWARWLVLIYFGSNALSNMKRLPLLALFPGMLFLLAIHLLFRPAASAFFRGASGAPPLSPKADETPTPSPATK